jgi:hypothetical protein
MTFLGPPCLVFFIKVCCMQGVQWGLVGRVQLRGRLGKEKVRGSLGEENKSIC